MNEKMEWNDGRCLLMMSQFDCLNIPITEELKDSLIESFQTPEGIIFHNCISAII